MAEFGKVFGDKISVVQAAFANMTTNSGERNNCDRTVYDRKGVM